MIERIREGLVSDGVLVSINKLCHWFDVPRRSFYYQRVKSKPKVQACLAELIKALIDKEPSFGYRIVAGLLSRNNAMKQMMQ